MDKRFATHTGPFGWVRRFWQKPWVRWAVGLAVGGAAAAFVALIVFAAWVSKDLPDPNSLNSFKVAQSTKIYDRTGTVLLYEIHGDENRTLIPIDQIPQIMRQATVAIEDRKFYDHHGVDWVGLVRAVVRNALRGQSPRGTSTLTQQLVRNTIIENTSGYLRKLKEMILSLQIERTFSKDQILQMYLNEIPYGNTIYGVESAAQNYFGKPTRDLTLDEAALLASIPQAPDRLSPYGTGVRGDNRPQLVQRQRLVIEKMAEQGFITEEQAEEAKKIDTLAKLKPQNIGNIKAPHFVMYIRSLLADQFAAEGGLKYVEQGGLRVITTLDWEKQQSAQRIVSDFVEKNGKTYQFNNAALVSLDPKTGQLLTMVGSADFFKKEIDGQVNVTLSARQPGSSFKPIVYAAAFAKGYLPSTEIYDTFTSFKTDGPNYEPRNYNLRDNGPVTLRKALQGSLNVPAVKLLYLVGVGPVLDFADQLGYTTLKDRSRFGLSLVLGGGEVTPLEHAHAFSAFANDGIQMPVTPILRVEANGKVLSEWQQPPGTRVVDQQTTRTLNDVLTDNEARTYVFGSRNSLTLPDRAVAAKTGTTNNYYDAWTVGYTPNFLTAVWVGNTKYVPMKRGSDSSTVAAPIWQAFMKEATKGMPKETFPKPEPSMETKPAIKGGALVKRLRIDKSTGLLATEFTPANQVEERTYLEPHDILYFIDKDDPLGDPPTNPANDPQFTAWETGVQNWLSRTNATTTAQAPTVSSDQYGPAFAPQLTILEPANQSAVRSRFVPIRVEASAPRGVANIQVRLGDRDLGSVQGTSQNFGVTIPEDLPDGFYDLVLTAKDDIGNSTSQTVTIHLQLQEDTGPGIFDGILTFPPTSSTTSF